MHAVDTFAANAIARITRMTCTHVGSFGVATSCVCMTRVPYPLIDIYDMHSLIFLICGNEME